MTAYALRSLSLRLAFLASFSLPVWAQAPQWQPVINGESLYVDVASISLNQHAPTGQKWVNFDAILNTPVPPNQEDAATLNAFFGMAPKTFFNHMTIDCTQMSVRENSSGIAHGVFQTPRRNTTGQAWQAFELDQLVEYDLHGQAHFESIADAPEATRYQQLLCQSDLDHPQDKNLSLVQLNQVLANVSNTPNLVALANTPNKYIDLTSITKRTDKAEVKDFNLVYMMPSDDPQFTAATKPYGLNSLTMVFDRSIDCQTHSMRSNYRAVVANYVPNALLLEYRPQEQATYLPISTEEQPLYDLVCPAKAIPAAVVTPTATGKQTKTPFRTEYE